MGTDTTVSGAGPARWPRLALPLQSDERLARLVGAGEDRAFAVLYQRYHQQLYRYCRSLLGHDADAQDALQAAFAGALSALREGRRDAPLRPWLYRIAHNEAVTLLRRRGRFSDHEDPDTGVGPSAEEQAAQRERLALLVADLGDLPERQRGALVMRELSGLSHEQIAVALQTSPRAAKQAIFEARRALHELQAGRAMACEEVCRMVSDGDGRALRARRVRGHLRSCSACASFAADIRTRRADLQALAPPLAPVAASGLLATLLGRAGSHHGGALAGLAGKSAGLAVATKAVVGITVVAGASFGLSRALPHPHPGVHTPAGHSAGSHARGIGHSAGAGEGAGGSSAGRTHGAVSTAARTRSTSSPHAAAPGSAARGRALGHGHLPSSRAHGRGAAGERSSRGRGGEHRSSGSQGHAVRPSPSRGKPAPRPAPAEHPAPATSRPETTPPVEPPAPVSQGGGRAGTSTPLAGEPAQAPARERASERP